MSDLLRALAISAGLLSLVVVWIIFISIIAVRRGEANVHGASAHHDVDHVVAAHGSAAAAAKPAKAGAAPATNDEISVINIVLAAVALFTLTVMALVGLSILQHL
jgi:hypothetical protein